jgi:LacI family gluconate utilization system Gnt-I transcriptional repressor
MNGSIKFPWRPAAITLTDVAREAGVGESTVSRVLRNRGAVSARTREKVEAVVARLGYVPNRIAGTLASTGSRLVAIIIPSLSNIVFPDILTGAGPVLDGAGYQSVIGVSDYDADREAMLIAAMLSWRPAALILAGLEHTDLAATMLRASGVRVAEILDTDGPALDLAVGFSNHAAGVTSAKFLLSRGYRKIGYVGGDFSRDVRAGKRFSGFAETLRQTGAPLAGAKFMPHPSSIEAGKLGLEMLLRDTQLDAVYFSNDDMAIGGYFHAAAAGIAIPRQLALMGHNGLDVARFAPQALTTILTPRRQTGEQAARLLLEDAPPGTHDLGFSLMEGQTA